MLVCEIERGMQMGTAQTLTLQSNDRLVYLLPSSAAYPDSRSQCLWAGGQSIKQTVSKTISSHLQAYCGSVQKFCKGIAVSSRFKCSRAVTNWASIGVTLPSTLASRLKDI